jgi:hypothetical protein
MAARNGTVGTVGMPLYWIADLVALGGWLGRSVIHSSQFSMAGKLKQQVWRNSSATHSHCS